MHGFSYSILTILLMDTYSAYKDLTMPSSDSEDDSDLPPVSFDLNEQTTTSEM